MALVRQLSAELYLSIVGVIIDEPDDDAAPLCSAARAAGIATAEFKAPGKLSSGAIGQLRRFIADEGVEILHTHGYKTDLIGRLATIGTGCLHVGTPHGWSTGAGFKLQCYEFIDRLIFPFMDAVVPLSRDLYAGLEKWPGVKRKLRLIPNGVDLAEIDALPAASGASGGDAETQCLTIGYIGQLIPRKGLATLIEAFAGLEVPEKRLILVGDGPQRIELEELARRSTAADSIRFLGFRLDRIELLKQFDIFVLPSTLEGIPRCLMEAMGAGIPVVASNIPGTNDLVEDGRNGLLFEAGDAAGLARLLAKVAGDAELRKKLSAAARRHVVRYYSAEAMARQYAKLYTSLLNAGGSDIATEAQ